MGEQKNKETKGVQGVGPPRGARLRLGWVPPGPEGPRKAPSWRSRSFTNLPGLKGARRELEKDPRRGRDTLRLSGTLTEHLSPRESTHTPG